MLESATVGTLLKTEKLLKVLLMPLRVTVDDPADVPSTSMCVNISLTPSPEVATDGVYGSLNLTFTTNVFDPLIARSTGVAGVTVERAAFTVMEPSADETPDSQSSIFSTSLKSP